MDAGGSGSRRARPLGVVVAVIGSALAIFALVHASRPRSTESTTTTSSNLVVAPPETTTNGSTNLSNPTTSTSAPPLLTDRLPGADGGLISVLSTDTGSYRLQAWSDLRAEERMPPMPDRPLLEFDAQDLRMAFLGPSSGFEGHPLFVGRPLDWQRIASRVTSFAWHTSIPGRLGWMEVDRGLCQADLHVNGAFVTEPVCDPDLAGDLVGLDDHGALLITGAEVFRVAPDGQEVARLPGLDAFPASDGRVLITSISSGEGKVGFDLASPDLNDIEGLDWAPAEAGGRHGVVAWSPRVTAPELAFLVKLDEGKHQIQRWDLEGNLLNALNLGGEVWGVQWDRSGRYVLAPGLVDGSFVVHVYDLMTSLLTSLPFDHRVEDTQMVIPAFCEDASALVDHWQERVSAGVAVVDMWMVSSRDSGLVSWRFVSGLLIGGEHDGEIATWAIPDYSGAGEPPLAIPANDAAVDPGQESLALDEAAYDVDEWMLIDGARISQWCLGASDD